MPARMGASLAKSASREFVSQVLLPAQQLGVRTRTPAHVLVAAVLGDAIQIIHKHRDAAQVSARRIYRETEDWFLCERRDVPFTFESICGYLNLDPESVRRGLGLGSVAVPVEKRGAIRPAAGYRFRPRGWPRRRGARQGGGSSGDAGSAAPRAAHAGESQGGGAP